MSIAFAIDGNGRAVLCLLGLTVYVVGLLRDGSCPSQ